MNFCKYFAFLAFLVFCVLGHQATEARFLGKVGHKLHHAVKSVEKVSNQISTAQNVVTVGGAVAGAIAA